MTTLGSGDGRNGGGDAMIVADQITRDYGPSIALRDISFQAYRGEILGFLGPNGAGKTTTMRILTGYMPPSSGSATIAGHDVVEASMEARAQIGYLPESAPLYPDMTVRGYLDFMARLRGVPDRSDAVDNAMYKVSIEDRADDLISHLSKGMRQRVGIAQAVVHDPPVIILDEPTIGLDPRQIREVRALIRELGGDHTVIISTHILPEAQQICDRVLIIHDGRIVAEDTPDELTAQISGGEQVRLGLAESVAEDDLRAALGEIEGVQGLEVEQPGRALLQSDGGDDTRAAMVRAVYDAGWTLLELSPQRMTLEDIFLELTDDGEVEDDDWYDDEDVDDDEQDGRADADDALTAESGEASA